MPFTVSPQLLHSLFLHPTGKGGGECGNVLRCRAEQEEVREGVT